jgi:hypothetical protein
MADTALDLVTNALLDLGVLADEEAPTASQAAGGLRKLNNLIESWNIEDLLVYGSTQSVFPLVANQGSYTIGTGGNFNTVRPNKIVRAYIRDLTQPAASRVDFPLYIYTTEEYADYALKGMTNNFVWGVYFDDDFPLITAYFTPIPSTSQYSFVMWTDGIIGNLTLDQTISLAPGYLRALEANLVIELAASYSVPIPQSVAAIAITSKADLKTKNFELNELTVDPRLAGQSYFNYYTGYSQGG